MQGFAARVFRFSGWKLAVVVAVVIAALGGAAFWGYAALNQTGAEGVRYRWANVSIEVRPQTGPSDIAVSRYDALPEIYSPSPDIWVPGLEIHKDVVVGDHIESSNVWVDATTGKVVHEDVRPQDRAEFDAVMATLRLEGPDPPDIWPYTAMSSPTTRRQFGNMSYVSPDPASGVMIGGAVSDPGGGTVLYISNGRSFRELDADTGEVFIDKVEPSDREAFDRVMSSMELLYKPLLGMICTNP
jgi:hypothetical protein